MTYIRHPGLRLVSTILTWLNCVGPCTVWVEKIPPPWNFLTFFPNGLEFLVQILHTYHSFLYTLKYNYVFNYLQLWRSYAISSATTIMYSKCPPLTETHAGWSHLIWHNFVIVGDNWIKICTLAYMWTFNRHVKFGLKILNHLWNMSENAMVDILCTWCELGGHA